VKKTLEPFEQVYEITKKIPRGKVFTYGLISKKMNGRLSAAAVGWALNALKQGRGKNGYSSETVPWQRVVNSKGTLSTSNESGELDDRGRPIKLQQVLLESEGVDFKDDQSIDFSRYLWTG
jgi:methylated-DNA-protein-cysteine methyltransferase related protein